MQSMLLLGVPLRMADEGAIVGQLTDQNVAHLGTTRWFEPSGGAG